MKFNRMELNAFDPDGVGVDNGTYFGLPFEPGTAELVLVSAPWDVTVSYGAGTAHAPDAVIEASTSMSRWLPACGAAVSPRPMWTMRCWRSRNACAAMRRR